MTAFPFVHGEAVVWLRPHALALHPLECTFESFAARERGTVRLANGSRLVVLLCDLRPAREVRP